MKKLIHGLIALVLILGIGACGFVNFEDSGNDYFHSSNEDFMETLKNKLDAESFKYSVDEKGYIRFSPKNKNLFYRIVENVEKKFVSGFTWHGGSGRSIIVGTGFKSTNKEYMQALIKELDSAGFKYSIDSEGMIQYSGGDYPEFKKIQAKIDKIFFLGTSISFPAKSSRESFIALLEKEGVEYTVVKKNEGIWVRWIPKDAEQNKKIWGKIYRDAMF